MMLEAALAYALMGAPVVVLHTPIILPDGTGICDCPKRELCGKDTGKHPRTMHGLDDATTDEAKIRRWFGIWPHGNIAVDLARAGLVDIAPDSVEWFAEFTARGLPATVSFASGGGEGHVHYWYARPEGCAIHRVTESEQYDILSNGYAVVPPSLHASGRRYAWTAGTPLTLPSTPAPTWSVVLLNAKASKRSAVTVPLDFESGGPPVVLRGEALERWHGRSVTNKPSGGVDRSWSLWRIAVDLLDAGAAQATAEAALAERDSALGFTKFTGRGDATDRYRIIVERARAGQGPRPIKLKTSRSNLGNFGANARARETVVAIDADEWPDPAELDRVERVPALPLECLPREVAELAEDIAERQQSPVDFVAWPMLVSLAVVCGRNVAIRPRAFDDWTERLALWVANIGSPSTMKTPAQEEGTRSIRRIAQRLHDEYKVTHAQWEADCAAEKAANPKHPDLPPEPVLERLWTADATIEKLATLLTDEVSRGLLVVRDELAGVVFDLNRYKATGGDRQFLLQAYSGGAYTVDRLSRPSIFIPDLLVSIVGGVQPERAREIFTGGVDDGLAARFLTVWPEVTSDFQTIDRLPDTRLRDALNDVADALFRTDWASVLLVDDFRPQPFCRLSPDAQTLFNEWHVATMKAARSRQVEARLAARIGKYPGLASRLILEWHLVEYAAGRESYPERVSANTVGKVLDLFDSYVEPMERRVYGEYASSPIAIAGRQVGAWIRQHETAALTPRNVRRLQYPGVREAGEAEAVVEWLCSMGWLREVERSRFGRPAQWYRVNPKLKVTSNGKVD